MAMKNSPTAAQDAAQKPEGPAADARTTEPKAAKNGAQAAVEYTKHIYIGPALPNGVLKQNAVLEGTKAEILEYYKDALEVYPQIKTLIVRLDSLGECLQEVDRRGTYLNKCRNDIVSAMAGKRKKED